MKSKRLLMVEGKDDFHVFCHIMEQYGVQEVFDVEDKKSVSKVLEALRLLLRIEDDEKKMQRIGIAVDADDDLEARWKQFVDRLTKAGYTNIPNVPEKGGTIIEAPDLPKIGIWLMPNNQLPGKLENFISFLVPREDSLWEEAKAAVQNLSEKRFQQKDEIKAHVHTWLAWQKDPGTPMGLAITKRYLQHDAAEAQSLVNWLTRLFVD
jgi:hypothetical protein